MKSHPESKLDNRQARGDATRETLMRTAEKLIAERGIENVTIRLILSEAGQKNTSALQYHFQNLSGLISAIHAARSKEIQEKRGELLEALRERTDEPDLRDLCAVMVQPLVELARTRVDYRRYVKAFGHELALIETSAFSRAGRHGGGGSSGVQLGSLLRKKLEHLDNDAFKRRMDMAVRLCGAAMYHQARQTKAFRGDQADLFASSLIDALTGLLGAPESVETRAIASKKH
jgi:AcrR family transcriptional regulator